MRETFEGPLNVLGLSTGGSLALQLASDSPELVDRLVLGGTACALGPVGKRAQRAYIERARRGERPSPAPAEMLTESVIGRMLLKGPPWLMNGRKDHADAATMMGAEDGFDLRGRLIRPHEGPDHSSGGGLRFISDGAHRTITRMARHACLRGPSGKASS
ncbi:alpha/beta hydrolase [Streptomyces sp. NBC_01142]|uniref:alpha/beta hydrolase n=1 Tax=Streptomyces sp. NBC_01142 TaxID=2975865 RepID=UPI00225C1EFD|nr:alpha/beta hydrolase [Streptomyces sp. NBC_01142]MCX4824128.1 alpha/beta hydrolase [Streptomyces sp. NBC_01142]